MVGCWASPEPGPGEDLASEPRPQKEPGALGLCGFSTFRPAGLPALDLLSPKPAKYTTEKKAPRKGAMMGAPVFSGVLARDLCPGYFMNFCSAVEKYAGLMGNPDVRTGPEGDTTMKR